MKLLKRTWANVDLDALAHNYNEIRGHVSKDCRFLGVMKADAYGHGAVPVSHALAELGAEYLAVSNLEEAVQLRRGGVRLPLLILGYTPAAYAENMVYLDLTQEVHSLQYALELDEALKGTNFVLNVHLKLDTGMTRIGFDTRTQQELDQIIEAARLTHLHAEGAFMHFCVADSMEESDVLFTKMQYDRFRTALDYMKANDVVPELCHCCNSGATILHPEYAMDMIRPGVITYGIHPSADTLGRMDLKPMMSVHTSIAQIRHIPAGTDVSYGRTYTSDKPRTIAVLTIGYADGLQRRLSGAASFVLHGVRVPIIGRICMDMCMVDITNVPQAQIGDEVLVIGEGNTCDDMAEQLDTISYEVLCGINKRIPRIYKQNGITSEILQYIV